MKKIISMMFLALLAITLIGCGGQTTQNTATEKIAAPTNLIINGKVLSWNAVTDADGYNVYANDALVTDVKNTTYDFSSMTEDSIIFRVQTIAPNGFLDSELSLSVAYVANKEAEVTSVNQAFSSYDMNVPDGFAEELVNKGMTSDNLGLMLTAMNNLQNMEEVDNFSDFYALVNALVNSTTNIEALVSALVKVAIPAAIDEELPYATGEELEMLSSMKSYFEDNPDEAIQAITKIMDYLMQIEQAISSDMVTNIDNLTQTESIESLNTNEIVLIKSEMVNILRDNMPSQDDFEMFVEFSNSLLQIFTASSQANSLVLDSTKTASQIRLSLSLMIDYLDSFDITYFNNIKTTAVADMDKGNLLDADIAILTIKHFAEFKNTNQSKFDAINALTSDADKEANFDYILDNMNIIMLDQSVNVVPIITALKAFDFQKLLAIQENLGESFDLILDKFVETDGAFLRQVAIMSSFHHEYDKSAMYSNPALEEDYSNYTEFSQAMNENALMLVKDAYELFYPALDNATEANFKTILDFVSVAVFTTLIAIPEITSDVLSEDVNFANIQTAINTFIGSSYDDIFQFEQNLTAFIDDNDVFGDILTVQEDINDYMIATYGNDYMDSSSQNYYSAQDDYFADYAYAVTFCQEYTSFMTSANRTLIDNVVDNAITLLTSEAFTSLIGTIDSESVTTLIDNTLDNILTQANVIKTYDYKNLTQTQMEYIDSFINNSNIFGISSPSIYN